MNKRKKERAKKNKERNERKKTFFKVVLNNSL